MRTNIAVIGITLIGFILRFYNLGEIPNGLYQDETAIGWNAYSILQTGKDEHGAFFPLYFKSFGDHKLPTYIYSTAISIKIFGLTPFAVRFPSAFFGSLTIPLFFFLVQKISKKKSLALLSSLLLAINPWHLHYSRATFEVSIVLFLFTSGLLLFHSAIEKKHFAFFGSIICFILGLYTYNLTRLLSPVVVVGMLFLYRKELHKISRSEKIATAVASGILLIPFLATYLHSGGVSSASGTLIFSSATVQAPLIEFRSYFVHLSLVNKLLFNSLTLNLWLYLQNTASYFSVLFFFISGSQHGNHGIGTHGQFFLFELPFMFIGLYILIKKRLYEFSSILFVGIATVIIASLTREAPHATRSFTLLLSLPVISALGILNTVNTFQKRNTLIRSGCWLFLSCFAIFSVSHYLFSYYIRFPILYAKQWREQDSVLTNYIKENWNTYDQILIDKNSGYIYSSILFYLPFSPQEFHTSVQRAPDDSEGMSEVVSFGKIIYKDVVLEKDVKIPNTLIVMKSDNIPNGFIPKKTFMFPSRPVVLALKQDIVSYPTQETAYVVFSSEE